MKNKNIIIVNILFVFIGIGVIFLLSRESKPVIVLNPESNELEGGDFLKEDGLPNSASATSAIAVLQRPQPTSSVSEPRMFSDAFLTPQTLEESAKISKSSNKNWWLNSGGRLYVSNGTAKTIQGDLAPSDAWYKRYIRSNPEDTDDGAHPQNIFRLVNTHVWGDFTQQAYFKINSLILSESPNRNASNGVLLFNRYQTGDDLYYTGIRVDGAAVIKKKIKGAYYTMAMKKIFGTKNQKYDRDSEPNLLPVATWIGVKSEVITNQDASVTIRLYVDEGKTGVWRLVLETKDKAESYGPSPLTNAGYAGIRTDFMDVEFDDYSIVEL
ncbi:MAG: hypothetical protein V4519_05115 [Patescibacteria group bacterium]